MAHGVAVRGVTSTANPAYGEEELVYQLRALGRKYAVTSAAGLEAMLAATARVGIPRERVILMDAHNVRALPEGDPLHDLCAGFACRVPLRCACEVPAAAARCEPTEDRLHLPYSSGTTGKPKGVQLTHFNMVANLMQHVAAEGRFFTPDDVVISPLPSFHCYGFLCNLNHSLQSQVITMPSHPSSSSASWWRSKGPRMVYAHYDPARQTPPQIRAPVATCPP